MLIIFFNLSPTINAQWIPDRLLNTQVLNMQKHLSIAHGYDNYSAVPDNLRHMIYAPDYNAWTSGHEHTQWICSAKRHYMWGSAYARALCLQRKLREPNKDPFSAEEAIFSVLSETPEYLKEDDTDYFRLPSPWVPEKWRIYDKDGNVDTIESCRNYYINSKKDLWWVMNGKIYVPPFLTVKNLKISYVPTDNA